MRVVVVGGGVVGLCCAWSLRRAGADVTVLEGGRVGEGASWGNAGWIVPSLAGPLPGPGVVALTMRSLGRPDSPVYLKPSLDPSLARWLFGFWRRCNARDYESGMEATARLGARTMELYDALAADGVDFQMRADGLLFAFRTGDHAVETLQGLKPMERHGYDLPHKVMATEELVDFEPALSTSVAAGFWIREERHVAPDTLTKGLAARLRAMGVDVREGAGVERFEGDAVIAGGERHAADTIVLASGAWTTAMARALGAPFPMQAGKGYSFSIAPGVMPRRPLYLSEAKVGCTPIGGRLRVAGTMELSGVNNRVDRRRVDAIVRGSAPFLSSWDGGGVQDVWAGMRPVAPDGLPILGRLTDNVVVATGHSMLGVTLAPATGELIAELITSGRTPDVLTPFRPDRFRRL